MKPLLKWVGGKTQLLDKIIEKLPEGNYHEPFLGGGSVLLEVLEKRNPAKVCASDINPILIDVYKSVQQTPERLIEELTELTEQYNSAVNKEEFYYALRNRFNTEKKPAQFIVLNKTCFRGIYREGPHGFNVPFGHYKNPSIFDEDHIKQVSTLIQNVEFCCESFEDALERVKEGDVVYLDPPYVPEKATSFVGYVSGGFSKHEELFDKVKTLPKFLLSNSNTPLVRQTFEGYSLEVISCKRTIHSKNPASKAEEVLIWN